jgi:hypothetical protein
MASHSLSAQLTGNNSDEKVGSLEEKEPMDLEKNAGVTEKVTVEPTSNGLGDSKDENIVWWDEPVDQDPENPKNWSERKKWGTIAIVSSITFIT